MVANRNTKEQDSKGCRKNDNKTKIANHRTRKEEHPLKKNGMF